MRFLGPYYVVKVGCSLSSIGHIFVSKLGTMCRYIHRELVFKNVFPRHSLPIFLKDWID